MEQVSPMCKTNFGGILIQAVIIKRSEEGEMYTVTLKDGGDLKGKLDQAGDWIWEEPCRQRN